MSTKKPKEIKLDTVTTPTPNSGTPIPIDKGLQSPGGAAGKKGLLGKISFRPFWMKKQDASNTLGFDATSEISSPFDFQHKGHVDYDDETGLTGFNEMLDSETPEQPLVDTVFVKQKDENEIQYDESIDTTGYTDTDIEQPLYLGN